ncbi:hypothetical protein MO973_01730, partial [Paenibacillus sp. TRM 82003]|nr:hypothetical protein [Paenibacillus sp. TRM 82003]
SAFILFHTRVFFDCIFIVALQELLLKSNIQLTECIDSLDTERSLACKFLFFLSLYQEDSFTGLNKYRQFRRALVRFVLNTEGKDVKNRPRVGVLNFLEALRQKSVTVSEFIQKDVPVDFFASLQVQKSVISANNCLTPWCSKVNKSAQMLKVDKEIFDLTKGAYSAVFICTECLIKYGWRKGEGVWETVDVDLERFNELIPLVKKGLSKAQLCRLTGVSERFSINRLLGYMLYQGLIPDDVRYLYAPNRKLDLNINDFINEFEMIFKQTRVIKEIVLKMKKNLGLEIIEVYYFMAHREYFINFISRKKRFNRGGEIAKKESWAEKVDLATRELALNEGQITMQQVAASLNVSDCYLTEMGLHRYIQHLRQEYNSKKQAADSEKIMSRLQEQIINMIEDGKPILKRDLIHSTCVDEVLLLTHSVHRLTA